MNGFQTGNMGFEAEEMDTDDCHVNAVMAYEDGTRMEQEDDR